MGSTCSMTKPQKCTTIVRKAQLTIEEPQDIKMFDFTANKIVTVPILKPAQCNSLMEKRYRMSKTPTKMTMGETTPVRIPEQ